MKHVERMLERMPSSRRAVNVAIAALCVVILALVGVLFWQVHKNADALANSAAVNRARGQALGTANAKLTQNGIPAVTPKPDKPTPGNTDLGPTTPSSTPQAEAGAQGEKGDQGPGPSTAQVAQAVSSYCDAHGDCSTKPTQAQVAAAVLTYCKGDTCEGDTGQRGLPGEDGTDATGAPGSPGASGEPGKDATGSQGPQGDPGQNATDEQVAAAVAAFCADGACRGPQGPAGPAGRDGKDATGAPGKDGRGIDSTICAADGHWHTVYTDGKTQDSGACRETSTVTAPPTSEPSSTATATP